MDLVFRMKTSTDGELNRRILCYVIAEVYESKEKVKESFGNTGEMTAEALFLCLTILECLNVYLKGFGVV